MKGEGERAITHFGVCVELQTEKMRGSGGRWNPKEGEGMEGEGVGEEGEEDCWPLLAGRKTRRREWLGRC